ncbi:calcyphosin-2 isoform X1 [Notechis scutatus]|uniref:Calcyphosin-2 isoform X1 n=1 Tax=Notechis scutatus TaxID=8663 RepID=A0A6J1U4H2_9SAUR|nr:calcyphosin-2 isoform X1 [Notechis scutatus]XP_026523500.1 calcyphosin-2 isoform X1 [Notechis scutatus]XP_026523501.1 calcyphosin-2 isoform X1 [Notechis scutatus]
MDLEVKGIAASPKRQVLLSSQGWRPNTRLSHGPRPAEVPCLDLGKLGDSEDEDGDNGSLYNAGRPHTGPPHISSSFRRDTQLQNTHPQYHNIEQAARRPDLKKIELSSKEQKTIPENLPLPTDIYKLKYQQYETEMKEGYKQYSQRAAKKKTNNNLFHELPGKIAEKKDLQPEKQRVDEFTILDEKALLQQGYTNNPYTMQHSIRKFDVEEVAAERKKQAVVEQVMLDQLCRAVISDPEQNGNSDIYKMDPVLPGLSTAPLRFRKRTLHETKIKTRSALTENMLSNKLRFDGRLLLRNGRDACRELIGFYFTCDKSLTIYEYRKFGKNRTNALPFIVKGIYMHQRGQKKGKPYTLNDFFVGADLTFLSLQHPGLPESVKQKPLFTIRVTNIDEMAKTFLKTYNVENEENPIKEEDDRKKTLRNVQDNLRTKLSKRGVRIVSGLGKYFRELDKKQNRIITKADYRQALKAFHLEVIEEEFESLWLVLHEDNNGELDYTEFTRAILGEMNEYRKAFVRKAYMKLDYNKIGRVPMVDIKKCYCARKHPQVIAGNATQEEIKSSFLETLEDACSNPSEVSFGEFEDYYEGLSIGILDDEDFINILRNSWGI